MAVQRLSIVVIETFLCKSVSLRVMFHVRVID